MDAHEHEAAGAIAGMMAVYGAPAPAPAIGDWVTFRDHDGRIVQGRVARYGGSFDRVWVTVGDESVLVWPRQLMRL